MSVNIDNPWDLGVDTEVEVNKKKEAPQELVNDLSKAGLELTPSLENIKHILQDVLAGDEAAADRPEFRNLNFSAIREAIKWLIETDSMSVTAKADLATSAWRVNFKAKPPTPAEFLSEYYIGAQAEALHKPLKDVFCEFLDPLKPYRTLVLTQCIGWGKSTLSTLAQLYISVHYAMMRRPYAFFGLAPSSIFTQCLGGWNQKKASELLLEPFIQILECSRYFKRVRTHNDLVEASAEEIKDCIHWTTSSPTSSLMMQNGVNYKVINGTGSILGQNIISAVISELTMFSENGWTDEKILNFFTKLRKRIDSRMKGNYYGRFIIDSQPNSLESPIDEWIWDSSTIANKENYIVTGSRWKYFPKEFPQAWEKPRDDWKQEECLKKDFINAFPIFKGGDGNAPHIIRTEDELKATNTCDIVWAPRRQITSSGVRDMMNACEESPINFLRDQAGIPSGAADRILYNNAWIDNIFDNDLRNIYSTVTALSTEEPEHLLWNKIKDKLFNFTLGKYFFYYEPDVPRSASIDLAISGDTASIAVSHVEMIKERVDDFGNPLKVFITDFVLNVIPKGGMINLDAFRFFILDLIKYGGINIKKVSFDAFQSRAIMQNLERNGISVEYLSVDKDNMPYLSLIDYITHGRYFCGKSIMVKNNLLSLHYSKRRSGSTKIDHFTGDNVYYDDFCQPYSDFTEESWRMSRVGINAKDATDAIAASIYLLEKYENLFRPIHFWNKHSTIEMSYDEKKNKLYGFLNKKLN